MSSFGNNDRTSKWMKKQTRVHDKTYRAELIESEYRSKKEKATPEYQARLQDSENRLKVHTIIRKMVEQGHTTLEILQVLSEHIEFEKYIPYFQSWIQDQQNKQSKKSSSKKEKEEQER